MQNTRVTWAAAHVLVLLAFWVALPAVANADKLEVSIKGVEGEIRNNVEIFLGIAQAARAHDKNLKEKILKEGNKQGQEPLTKREIQRLHRQAPQEIHQALQPFGYYDPDIKSELAKVDGVWQATYHIDPGPPIVLQTVELRIEGEAQTEPAVKDALASIELVQGQRLVQSKYEQAKSKLSGVLYNLGYLDAKYQRSEILVKPGQHAAEIHLVMQSGERFYFGPVTVEQEILRPDFVDRFVKIHQGERFDANRLVNLQLALNDTEYFSEVEIQAERKAAVDHHIPIQVKTQPSPPRRYTAGVGFGTDTGPRVRGSAIFRRINQRGHKLRLDGRLSLIERSISGQYQIPIGNVLTDTLAFTASASQEEIGDADTTQFLLGGSQNVVWRGFRRRIYLNLSREDFDFGDGTQTSILLVPGASLARQQADDQLVPTKGYSATLDVHGGIESPVTETTFFQTMIEGRGVYPLAEDARLLLHAEYGATETTSFSDLPPSERFFTGGARSVRGYGYQELGPENDDGDTIGGPYVVLGSVEADYIFYKDFGAATFFDAGNASNDVLPSVKKGTGIGLRYRSPIGMIRLDFAHPLDDPDTAFRLHISIGPDL